MKPRTIVVDASPGDLLPETRPAPSAPPGYGTGSSAKPVLLFVVALFAVPFMLLLGWPFLVAIAIAFVVWRWWRPLLIMGFVAGAADELKLPDAVGIVAVLLVLAWYWRRR